MSALNQCRYCLTTIPSGAMYCTVCEIERSATGFEKLYGREAGLQIRRELEEREARKRQAEEAKLTADSLRERIERAQATESMRRQEAYDIWYEGQMREQLEQAKREAYAEILRMQINPPYIATRTQRAAPGDWAQRLPSPPSAAPPKPKAPTAPAKPNKLGRQIDLDEE